MKRLSVALLSLLAVGACRARPVSGIPDGAATGTAASTATSNRVPRMSQPPPGGIAMSMSSYSAKYASPARNSRVAVRGRPLSSVHRVVSLEAAPRLVLTNDAGDHVVLDYGERYEVRTADGAVTAHDSKMSEPALLVWPHSLIVDDTEHDFAGGARTVAALMTRTGSNDTAWAIEVGEKTATYIVQQHASEYASTEPVPGTDVGARAWNKLQMKLVVDSIVFYTSHASDTRVWTQEFEGGGCGAVGTDRFIAVATTDQRFVAYDANAKGVGGLPPQPLATAHLAFVPYDISIVDGGVAVLSGGKGSSTVHMLARDGRELWQASVPFTVDTPPIDAGGGRVYLVGDGFAAADHGKILWSQKSTAHPYATSLADGSALLAIGPELRVVSRDGTVVQRLRVPEGDALVVPPAITADGTVCLATAKALYVVR